MTLISTVLRKWMDLEAHKPLTAGLVLGVDEKTVCNWLIGRSIPRDENLSRLALAMCASGLEVSYFKALDCIYVLAQFDRQHYQNRIVKS